MGYGTLRASQRNKSSTRQYLHVTELVPDKKGALMRLWALLLIPSYPSSGFFVFVLLKLNANPLLRIICCSRGCFFCCCCDGDRWRVDIGKYNIGTSTWMPIIGRGGAG